MANHGPKSTSTTPEPPSTRGTSSTDPREAPRPTQQDSATTPPAPGVSGSTGGSITGDMPIVPPAGSVSAELAPLAGAVQSQPVIVQGTPVAPIGAQVSQNPEARAMAIGAKNPTTVPAAVPLPPSGDPTALPGVTAASLDAGLNRSDLSRAPFVAVSSISQKGFTRSGMRFGPSPTILNTAQIDPVVLDRLAVEPALRIQGLTAKEAEQLAIDTEQTSSLDTRGVAELRVALQDAINRANASERHAAELQGLLDQGKLGIVPSHARVTARDFGH